MKLRDQFKLQPTLHQRLYDIKKNSVSKYRQLRNTVYSMNSLRINYGRQDGCCVVEGVAGGRARATSAARGIVVRDRR